jgi:hypothetical protein
MSLRIYQPSDLRRLLKGYKPGWFSNKAGGGGGGLASVSHDATLSGLGTAGTPLTVDHPAGWPTRMFQVGGNSGGVGHSFPTNTLDIHGFQLPVQLTFDHIWLEIDASDAGGLYDCGVYNLAGTLIADIGAQALPATGNLAFATAQGAKTLNPGIYFIVFTGNASVAQYGLTFLSRGVTAFASTLATQTSVGGACPATITPLAESIATTMGYFALYS